MESGSLQNRIRKIGEGNKKGLCVLYVMSRDQRVKDNHALLAAQQHALRMKLPLAVVFCLYTKLGYRSREHYEFMLEGLTEVETSLSKLNIPFMMLIGNPEERLSGMFYHVKPDAVYFDFSPLRGAINLHKKLADKASFSVYEVDTHNIVPVWVASDKQEVGARILRPKIHKLLESYLIEPKIPLLHPFKWTGPVIKINDLKSRIEEVLDGVTRNHQNLTFISGEKAAHLELNNFLSKRLKGYAEDRNDPTKDGLSGLSPYLHFGQLSSLRVALSAPNSDVLLEEMIIRKELSDNFCFYNNDYDSLKGAPNWAQITLKKHESDQREFVYSIKEFESAATHDPAWNAAQRQLMQTGKMHGYMRMYWAKKVLEWSSSAQEAINILIYLNDFYSIDGGDPNGYTGIMWSVAGVHDRPWGERPVYGMIRSMVYTGLKRKFDIAAYEKIWNT